MVHLLSTPRVLCVISTAIGWVVVVVEVVVDVDPEVDVVVVRTDSADVDVLVVLRLKSCTGKVAMPMGRGS